MCQVDLAKKVKHCDSFWSHCTCQDAHPATTPLDPHTIIPEDLSPTSEEEKIWMKKIPYLTAVGSIMYAATVTLPDVTYANNISVNSTAIWAMHIGLPHNMPFHIYMLPK